MTSATTAPTIDDDEGRSTGSQDGVGTPLGAFTSVTTRRILAALLCATCVALASAGCSSVVGPTATPCPGLAGWPPAALPAPPASILVVHPEGTAVRVVNGSDAPIKIRYTVWTPLDCDLLPPPVPRDNGSLLAPGRSAEWSLNDLVPAAGPVLGGIEVWIHPCDERCPDLPDAFVSFELARPSG